MLLAGLLGNPPDSQVKPCGLSLDSGARRALREKQANPRGPPDLQNGQNHGPISQNSAYRQHKVQYFGVLLPILFFGILGQHFGHVEGPGLSKHPIQPHGGSVDLVRALSTL